MRGPEPNNPLVRLEGVSKHFGEGEARVDALRDVSLEVFPRQVVALLGPSGSGKTTLLNVIGCILDPSAGAMVTTPECRPSFAAMSSTNARNIRKAFAASGLFIMSLTCHSRPFLKTWK